MQINNKLKEFFYRIEEDYILNSLIVIQFLLKIDAHKERIQGILEINYTQTTLGELSTAIDSEILRYESSAKEDTKYLMSEIITGRGISAIKETPVTWCFISLYWAYDFKNKTHEELFKIYNPNIGDIALKFLLYFKKMKRKEESSKSSPHKNSFYEDLSARLVRIIDILPAMDRVNSEHLNNLYLPTSKTDYAKNFLNVQINNYWEASVLLVVEVKSANNIIQYKHIGENINLCVIPSRMTKIGAFSDLDKTYSQLMQLQNLDLATSGSKYNLGRRRKGSKKKVSVVVSELEKELIYDDQTDSEVSSREDEIEQKSKRESYRRDLKELATHDEENNDDTKKHVVPNAFKQHKRNLAYSASLAKQKLLLESDYAIPPIPHLRTFIESLHDTEFLDSKIYAGFFILNLSLGCSYKNLLHLLLERKQNTMQLKNDIITVDLDTSLFASNFNNFLPENNNQLRFSIPIVMSILIIRLKKTFLNDDFNEEKFLLKYKAYLKLSIKKFSHKIIIKWKYLHRYLAQYAQKNAKDTLTSKFATAIYTQNDSAKLAYTSSRSNATEHAQLIKNYWHALDLNSVVCDILEIPNNYSSHTTSISEEKYSGSSQSVEIDTARNFFHALRDKIYNYSKDDDVYFNLVTIYTRYAMSLLAGTRPFKESANFNSHDVEKALWVISEKSQDIASGTRMVPLCNTINKILIDYKKLLKDKDFKNDFYLLVADKKVKFSPYEAHKILSNTLDDDILQQYIMHVPLNSGRHLFTKMAIDSLINSYYISTYLGHYSAGEEQLGRYYTLNIPQYCKAIKKVTTKIAIDCGIKEL